MNPNYAAGWRLSAWVQIYLGNHQTALRVGSIAPAGVVSIGSDWIFLRQRGLPLSIRVSDMMTASS